MAFSSTQLSQLLEQIKSKDKCKIEEVKSAVAKNNLQSPVDEVNNTLLHYAAEWNNALVTQHLIDLGSQVDAQNSDGKTPLMLAAEKLCNDTIEILINAGASVSVKDKLGYSILLMIGINDSLRARDDIVRILLKNSHLSIDNGTIAKRLREYNWSLAKVILLRNANTTKLILDSEIFGKIEDVINDSDRYFNYATALHMAVKYADTENVKLLLSYGADIHETDNDGEKPISYLYSKGDISEHTNEKLEIMKMLLEHLINDRKAIDVNMPSLIDRINRFIKKNCMDYESSREEAIDLLLQTGLDLSMAVISNFSQRTLVHYLAVNENPGVIERLRGKSFNVNLRTTEEETPLWIAAAFGIPNAVEFLIVAGADVDALDQCNYTPLFAAIYYSYKSRELQYKNCVQLLLEYSANAQIERVGLYTGDPNRTVFDMVKKDSAFALAELVVSYLALQEAQGTPLTKLINNKIESREQFKTNFESSRRELEVKVYQSITLLDLLTDSEKNFERYVRNQEIYSQLEDYSSKACQFYYFKTILQKRISKATHTVEMRKKSAQIICGFMKCLNFDRFPPLIGDKIAGYLEHNDMKNLFNSILQE